jgi:hypothetical protein
VEEEVVEQVLALVQALVQARVQGPEDAARQQQQQEGSSSSSSSSMCSGAQLPAVGSERGAKRRMKGKGNKGCDTYNQM